MTSRTATIRWLLGTTLALAWFAGSALAGPRCGPNVCADDELCCNDSCGICAPVGGACIQPDCGWSRDRAGAHAPVLDGAAPSPLPTWAVRLDGAAADVDTRALGLHVVAPIAASLSLQAQVRDFAAVDDAARTLWLGAGWHLPTGAPQLQAVVGLGGGLVSVAKALRSPGSAASGLTVGALAAHGVDAFAGLLWGRGIFGLSAIGRVGWNLAADTAASAPRWQAAATGDVVLPPFALPLAARVTVRAGGVAPGSPAASIGLRGRVGATVALAFALAEWAVGVESHWGRVDDVLVARAPVLGLFARWRAR